MARHKRYTLWLLFLVLAEMSGLGGTILYLEPISGDLMHYGYAENEFGWNQPQKNFEYKPPPNWETYDQYSDVVVLGDSFSFYGTPQGLNSPWQTYFTAETGWSVATFTNYKKNTTPLRYDPEIIKSVVNSEAFRKTPPKVLVLEVVERHLTILADVGGECQARQPIKQNTYRVFNPKSELVATIDIPRKEAHMPNEKPLLLKEKIAYAKKFLQVRFGFNFFEHSYVRELELSNPNLFSNKRSDTALIYQNDVNKVTWGEDKFAIIHCNLLKMQNLVQANGKTLFVVMLVPDKLTAYSHVLKDKSLSELSLIGRLASDTSLHLARLDLALQAVIDAGKVDVYLPNDTHWGYLGHQTAAQALAAYIKEFPGD